MSTQNRYAFQDRVVLVTGGGSGIGQAIARAFLDNGASVAVVGRRREKLDATLAGYDAARVLAIPADLTDPAQAAGVVSTVVERFGHLDVFVNNAGKALPKPLTEVTAEEWADLRATNLDAFVLLAQQALPELVTTKGNVVVVGSVSGMRGDWGQSAYNATKAAVMNFAQSLALDYGPQGVRVNAVAPSFTFTEASAAVADDEAVVAQFVHRVALGRAAEPADIAPAVLFLASPDAGYITGAILTVDGGTSASTGQARLG